MTDAPAAPQPTAESEEVGSILESLAGQKAPLSFVGLRRVALFESGRGIGYSQLNELLLLLGFDRVTHAFFQYLVDGSTEYEFGSSIQSLEALRAGVERFRKLALLIYGNVKYAFKTLSRDAGELRLWLETLQPIDESRYKKRHDPIHPLLQITPESTYYLGYVVHREIKARLAKDPNDQTARADDQRRRQIVEKGIHNHNAYLASDHLDVYVATSMRERHEYLQINQLGREIFEHPTIRELKLRWFDPTQAYCEDRIDKGLSEALMLKRAKCTLYLAQESDTLGKDSELASTLAQGKPVIAYVPRVDDQYVSRLLASLTAIYTDKSEAELILHQLEMLNPRSLWADGELRKILDAPSKADVPALRQRLQQVMTRHYDSRADLLRNAHPLGIQVNLTTGVANGVLVVRGVDQCAELIRRVVTNRLEFKLETKNIGGNDYLLLRETISESIFRVVTGDAMLMNAFWNFYLETAE